jgi:hypothetical protein
MSSESNSEEKKPQTMTGGKEQWLTTQDYACVRCNAKFSSRKELIRHYDQSGHDKYSAW